MLNSEPFINDWYIPFPLKDFYKSLEALKWLNQAEITQQKTVSFLKL